jgi:hypothetical protein
VIVVTGCVAVMTLVIVAACVIVTVIVIVAACVIVTVTVIVVVSARLVVNTFPCRQDPSACRGDPLLGDPFELVVDGQCLGDGREHGRVRAGGDECPQKYVAGGTCPAVESECSHTSLDVVATEV